MDPDTSASPPIKHKLQWLLIALLITSSFACVFISAQAALMSDTERVINANMLAESGVRYDLDNEDQFDFAPLDSNVIIEVTRDANGLQITPSTPDATDAPVLIAKLPDTATSIPTQVLDTATQTNVPRVTATSYPPSETPIPPSATSIPASETPIPPTLTDTSTSVPIPPTWTPVPTTKKPKKPTDTPIPPTATNTNTPEVRLVTFTPIPSSTLTLSLSPTPTPTDTPTFTLTPSLTFTSGPTSTFTPIPPPTNTPIPPYRHIKPLLNCVRDNLDGTYTAYFGYNNKNSYDVTIPIGNNNTFIPLPADRGQPKTFSPGRHNFKFDVTFTVAIAWWVDDNIEFAIPGNDCSTP